MLMSVKPANDLTYTLDDLREWDRSGTWLAVLGHPIHHSLSPHMHNAALEVMSGEDQRYADWKYIRVDVPVEDLSEALELLHAKQFKGVNLTIPHKVEALNWIHAIDADARSIGAVNTLLWSDAGYYGFNTDGYGMETAILRNLETSLVDLPIVLLGAGGAARAAAVQCIIRGCREIWIGNRSKGRLDSLVSDLSEIYSDVTIHPFAFEDGQRTLPTNALVINATSTGLKEDDSLPFDVSCFSAKSVFFDMIYNPSETIMMQAFASQGAQVCNGLDMLVYQGARALEIWSGRDMVPEDAMREAALGVE